MQNVIRILTVVLTTQSVGCAMLVGNPNPASTMQDDHNSHQPVATQPNTTMPSYEGNVVAWQYSPIVARSTASNSSLGAKATEVVEADRAAKQEARRQRDQRFAEVQKEVTAQLQQRQFAPVVTEAFPPPSLPVDANSTSASIASPRREVKKKLYLDDAQYQQVTSTAVSPIAVNPQPWQSISTRPLAIVTMVVIVLSGVTWPLTRSQRIAQLFARFHRSEDNAEVESTGQSSNLAQPTVALSETVNRSADESIRNDLECTVENTSIEAETYFSSCDPIAEDKQAWLAEFEAASADFMVVCVDSWSHDDLIAPSTTKPEQLEASPNQNSEAQPVTEPNTNKTANPVEIAAATTESHSRTTPSEPSEPSEPESITAETVHPIEFEAKERTCRALIAVNKRIVIGSQRTLPALALEQTAAPTSETGESTLSESQSSSNETATTTRVRGYIASCPKPRGVSLMGLPAKGPAKPVYPKLMPPAQVQTEVESQIDDCGESRSEYTSHGSFQEFDSIGSAQKFVGFVVLFAEDGTIGSFQKLMIVESFQLKDHSQLTANVVRVA